jgi:membrane fusion protein (multidrug efflux system)
VKNNLAAEVIVKTGIRTDAFIQITEGLKAGDTLITSGIMSIKEGSLLKLK